MECDEVTAATAKIRTHHDDLFLSCPELGVPKNPRHLLVDIQLPLRGYSSRHAPAPTGAIAAPTRTSLSCIGKQSGGMPHGES